MWRSCANKLPVALALAAASVPATAADGGDLAAMARVPAGVYRPLYADSDANIGPAAQSAGQPVGEFLMDRRAVTNAEFLQFVRAAPKWRRSHAPKIFADDNYLSHWSGDEALGDANPDAPAVNVSWFAAAAYCRAQRKTLPSVAQWERAAAASETAAEGTSDPEFTRRILEWYAAPADQPPAVAAGFQNLYGIRDMHGLIWEWTLDFNTELITGESRGDTGLARQLFCGAASIGAADPRDYPAFMRRAFRSSLEGRYSVGSLGFRCAAPPELAEQT